MSNECDKYSVAERYRTVRKHLDVLGYKQALSLDSLPLIELLLVDLAETKESLKHFQAIAKDNLEECSQLQLAVDPYKCDNAKLVQECNQLHLELIEGKETIQKQANDYKRKIRRLESELSDLKLSFSNNLRRIKQLETENKEKSKKLLELQGKCSKPIINNALTKKRPFYSRRPVLKADHLPEGIDPLPITFSNSKVEPYVADFVSMADQRIRSLTTEVKTLKEDLFISNENIETLKSQLNTKDKEIRRLGQMLEGGRPCNSINRDHYCIRSDKLNGFPRKLEDELLNLREAKLKLEQQFKEALSKQRESMEQAIKLAERNEELEKELKGFDRMVLAVEADCNSTVKENNKRVCRLQEKLEAVMTQVHVLDGELTVQRREAQELRADLEACRLEKSSVQRVLESTLEEKKQMTDRINNLTLMETNFSNEIDRLTRENEVQKNVINELEHGNKNLDTKNLANTDLLKNVKMNNSEINKKEEKAKANTKNKFMRQSTPVSKAQEISVGQEEKMDASNKKKNLRECACGNEVTYEPSKNSTDKLVHDKNVIIESLQNTIERLESERDYYKSEYVKFKDQFQKDTGKENEDMWLQICELRAQMSEKENVITKLLREKKDLCQEKFNLEDRLIKVQCQERSSSPCHFCRCRSSPLGEKHILVSNNKIERLERERDNARSDIERLIEERDALRERLKLATEAHVSEQRRLRESLCESESRLRRIERERRELLIAQGSRKAALSGLDDQVDDLKDELRRTKQELSEQRTQYFQLRALHDQTDQALSDMQGQLTQCENELSNALDRNKNTERQQLQLDNQIKELQQEIGNHHSKLAQMDREKDQLLMDLDEKTEKIAALEREIVYKEQQVSSMEQQIRDLTHTKEVCIDKAADAECRIRSMQLDMDNVHRQLSSATQDRESAIQENRRLADDLAAVSCEVRNMYKELEATKAESHDLKRQLQTYVMEVRRAEELIGQKENERTEMLNHFRSLSLEATVLENNNHSLETEAAEARGALQSARDQIMDIERQLHDKDSLIRGYEAQITELTQNVASLEIQLQQATDQRLRAEEDVRTVRELCMTLEQQKDCINRRLDETTELKSKYELQASKYRAEQDIFHEQMNKDHLMIDRLEKILEDSRKETIASQTNNRELKSEVTRLKQKISDLQSKLTSESSEVRKYQTQAADYSKQVGELRRQVTNERFERARLQETHRCAKNQTNSQPPYAMRSVNCSGRACACNSNSSNSSGGGNESKPEYYKIRVRETSTSYDSNECRNKITEGKPIRFNNNFNVCAHCGKEEQLELQQQRLFRDKNVFCPCITFDNVNKNTGCTSKLKINDIIANSKSNKPNTHIDLFKRNSCSKPYLYSNASQTSIRCGQCGGTMKQKQDKNSNEASWIIETLSLMNKILEEKRIARTQKCTRGKSCCNNVELPKVVNRNEINYKEKPVKDTDDSNIKQGNFKYSVMGSTNCTVSTQTVDSNNKNTEKSRPKLLQILSEIQHYAKNIENYFIAMNETLKNVSRDSRRAEQYENQQRDKCEELAEKISDNSVDSKRTCYVDAASVGQPIDQECIRNISQETCMLISSTSRSSADLIQQNIDGVELMSLSTNLDSIPDNDTDTALSGSKSTEYLALPSKITRTSSEKRPVEDLNELEVRDVVELQSGMDSIQEKIERLQRDITSDLEEISNDDDSDGEEKSDKENNGDGKDKGG